MQDYPQKDKDNEIDLREIFAYLWGHMFFIACICACGLFYGGYKALTTEKKYTSTATFSLGNPGQSTPFSGEMNTFARIAGIDLNNGNVSIPIDEVMGREFIMALDQSMNLRNDSFFQKYTPDIKEQFWKTYIKSLIGWQTKSTNQDEIIWQGISNVYKKNVELEQTENNAINITVTHSNSSRAAEIANTIMNTIIETTEKQSIIRQNNQLNYLAETLAKALQDMEDALSRQKNFRLKNSALPLESFASWTLKLDTLREQLARTSELHDAIAELSSLIEAGTTSDRDYFNLRKKFPIVDQVEFRRVLGQNEIISSWNWPDPISVISVTSTLSDRRNRLQSEIVAVQLEAENATKSLEEYTSLEREVTISEANYTILMEQVKGKSLVAGYRPDTYRIFEYAAPPLYASSPNRNLFLALGGILGLILGCVLVLIFALFRGANYTHRSLIDNAQARLNIKAHSLLATINLPLAKLNGRLSNRSRTVLRNLAVEIHRGGYKQVLFTSLGSKLTGNDLARALACYMQSNDFKIALINFTAKSQKIESKEKVSTNEFFTVIENMAQLYVLQPINKSQPIELLGEQNFQHQLRSLETNYDLIFLSAENTNAISLANALAGGKLSHISVTKRKRTKSKTLIYLRTLIPIQGHLYE